jgi:hypothetical protein
MKLTALGTATGTGARARCGIAARPRGLAALLASLMGVNLALGELYNRC